MGILAVKKIGTHLLVAMMLLAAVRPAHAIPAFARKYGLPCSACHEAWPMLNNFGQTFKDNGYQLGNDRDSPVYQQPGYWPIMFRVTPNWHRENTNRVALDKIPGNKTSGLVESGVSKSGFDLSAIDRRLHPLSPSDLVTRLRAHADDPQLLDGLRVLLDSKQ